MANIIKSMYLEINRRQLPLFYKIYYQYDPTGCIAPLPAAMTLIQDTSFR